METAKPRLMLSLRGMAPILWLATALLAHAQTVWTGPSITFSQPTPDPTQVSNQDRITTDVWLTRASSKGLFNAFYETNATTLSPTNAEWAFGTISNYSSLHYTNWLAWLNGQSPTTMVGQPAVLHLISDNIYVSIQFTFWGSMNSGGFAYQRSTAPIVISGAKAMGEQFAFNYVAITNFTYVIQSSSNLLNWGPLATNVASSNPMPFSEPMNSSGAKYYRVMWTDP